MLARRLRVAQTDVARGRLAGLRVAAETVRIELGTLAEVEAQVLTEALRLCQGGRAGATWAVPADGRVITGDDNIVSGNTFEGQQAAGATANRLRRRRR